MRRGEVWLAALDPTRGAEIQKTRPCAIVSPDELNEALRTVLVCPMTTGGRAAAFRPAVRFRGASGLLLPDQVRAVDKSRLVRRLGRLDRPTLRSLLEVMAEMFAP
ncbi:MAG TPA: type II toxin-antitoxin system PemK/MazF family toxin [Caulobacteraceae bacterium]|nr:type II toxin-antitoxin system PemK/MazF family toxin [Caulobacteraceae bacterium]